MMNDGINVLRPVQRPQEAPEPAQVPDPDPEPELAGDAPGQGGFAAEVAELSVSEVMAKVEAGEWDPAEVFVAEEDGKGRSTLLRALEAHAG